MSKRLFDIVLSILLLLLFWWLILILFLSSTIIFRENGFFIQKRIGKNKEEFLIIKIRSLPKDNKRVNTYGEFIRKMKLDEVPQLLNILLGNMSFVGPRPQLPEYHEKYSSYPEELYKIKPGLTGLASLFFFHENKMKEELPQQLLFEDWCYEKKNSLDVIYYNHMSLCYDIKIISLTFKKVIWS